jgi:hypothetical protein
LNCFVVVVIVHVDVMILSPNCGHQWAYFSSPKWYMSMESHGGMILTGKPEELRENLSQ